MLKNQLLFIALLFSILISNAQAPDSIGKQSRFIKSLRINYNYNHYYDFYRFSEYSDLNFKDPTSLIGNIGLGYTLKSRKNFNSHDLELNNVGWDASKYEQYYDTGYANTQNLAVRYQYNYFFIKHNTLLSPYLGISSLFAFSRYNQVNEHVGENSHSTQLGLADQIALIPGIQFRLNDRIYLDLSIPITCLRASFFSHGGFSGNADSDYIIHRYSDLFSFFNKDYYQLRLGVGVILNSDKRKNVTNGKYIKTFKFNFSQDNYFYKNFHNAGTGFSGFTPVVTFQNTVSRNMHEIELSVFNGRRDKFNVGIGNNYSFGLRYQFDYFFIKRPSMFSPYIGISFLFYYDRYNFSGNNSPAYNSYSWAFLYNYNSLVPGIQYYPHNRLYLDLSLPINLFETQSGKLHYNDPAYSKNNFSGIYGRIPNRYNFWDLRIGIGFKL
jgi:outer membrane protein W